MKLFIAVILGLIILFAMQYGPEFLQYNPYRIYKEIRDIKSRLNSLEAK